MFQFDEKVLGRANLGSRTGERAFRINQFGRRISGPATAAIVARLINRVATWASSTDKAIRQKGALLHIEQLLDVFLFNEPRLANRLPDLVAMRLRFGTVCAAVMVELDAEPGEISLVSRLGFRDDLFFATTFSTSPNHDRRAMRVVSTNVQTAVASQLLKAHPNIGLQIFNQMPQVNRSIRVGQCGRGQDSSFAHQIRLC